MKWVTQRPTTNGFYWIKRPNSSGVRYITVVKVYGRNGPSYIFADGDNFTLEGYDVLLWSDRPIPEPQEE